MRAVECGHSVKNELDSAVEFEKKHPNMGSARQGIYLSNIGHILGNKFAK